MLPATTLPLTGLTVADLTDGLGELCGRLLADLGADVVRVEPPHGATTRRRPPLVDDRSAFDLLRSSGKESVTVDVDTPGGRERLAALLGTCDVVVESDPPGRLAAAGLAPTSLVAEHGHLVVCSIVPFGAPGPYASYVATDPVLVAMSGHLFRSGTPDRPPLLFPGSLASDVAGVMAAVAVLLGLTQRDRTGCGQHLEVSAFEAATQLADWVIPNQTAIANAGGTYSQLRSGARPVYPMYRCRDGWVRLIVLSPRQWRALRAWLGEPDFLQDPHWDSVLARLQIQADLLDPLYEELLAPLTRREACEEAQRRGIAMAPVLSPAEVLTCPHLLARSSFCDLELDDGQVARVPASLFEIDGSRAGVRRQPGPLGSTTGLRAGPAGAHLDGDEEAGDAGQPLAGLLVVDFGQGNAGVEAGRILAEHGASVVKVESSVSPDFIRMIGTGTMSPSFASSSRSKRSLGVDVKQAAGADLVRRLLERADVAIENFAAGTMERLGLGYERLRTTNPGLVMASTHLMGSRGPWRSWIGYGPSAQSAGGLSWLWRFPDDETPPGSASILPDHLVGRLLALGTLAALWARRRTGRGLHLEVTQVEVAAHLVGDALIAESLRPGAARPLGNAAEAAAPWGVYRCAGEERYCVITCRDDDDWGRLCAALDRQDWGEDPRLATAAGRVHHRQWLDAELEAVTARWEDRTLMAHLQAFGVPAGAMAYASDLAADPQLAARGFLVEVDQPDLGPLTLEGPCVRGGALPPPIIGPAPRLGEHTRQVAEELLGLTPPEVEAHLAAGVLEEPALDADGHRR